MNDPQTRATIIYPHFISYVVQVQVLLRTSQTNLIISCYISYILPFPLLYFHILSQNEPFSKQYMTRCTNCLFTKYFQIYQPLCLQSVINNFLKQYQSLRIDINIVTIGSGNNIKKYNIITLIITNSKYFYFN